jgi:prevent-host-death family protein
MFNIAEDICSMTEFKRRTAEVVTRLRDTGRAVVLTTNGKADVVVQDAASYQRLMDRLQAYERREKAPPRDRTPEFAQR